MIAILKIVDYSVKEATTVPVNIIQADNNGKYVFAVEQSGNKTIAKKRMVTTGKSYDGEVEILSGLKAGDKVVSVGFQSLEDGVTVINN